MTQVLRPFWEQISRQSVQSSRKKISRQSIVHYSILGMNFEAVRIVGSTEIKVRIGPYIRQHINQECPYGQFVTVFEEAG